MATLITTILTDIGGVLLTNGWDRHSRELAAKTFRLDLEDLNSRHQLTFDTYEIGKISLEEYMRRTVFYRKRKFTMAEYKKFMLAQSQPLPDMLALMRNIKAKNKLKIGVVSNEGRELAEYRIKKFKLGQFVDFFIVSSFVQLRKPDTEIYKIALDATQEPLKNTLFIDDREMFAQVAGSLGINSIQHKDYATTLKKLSLHGLQV